MRALPLVLLVPILFLAGCTAPPVSSAPVPSSQPVAAPLPSPEPAPASPRVQVPSPVAGSGDTPASSAVPEPESTLIVPVPVPSAESSPPLLVNGKTLEERVQEAFDRLHTDGSGPQIRNDFPDIEQVYSDSASGSGFPNQILPFRYYYSPEANRTFSICNIDLTVFICQGRLDHLIAREDIESGRCETTPVYQSDPRLGYGGYGSAGG